MPEPVTFVADSSALHFARYSPDTGVLKVWFVKGGTARYGGVTPAEFAELQAAPSVGRYFNAVIRRKGSF